MQRQYTFDVASEELSYGQALGFDLVSLAGGGFLAEPGKPMLPTRQIRIALPAGLQATDLEVVAQEREILAGHYEILPAQPPVAISAGARPPFTEPDPIIYGSAEPYPARSAVLLAQTDFAGQPMAVVEVRPLRYVPTSGRLDRLVELTVELTLAPGYVCGDYLPSNASAEARADYEQRLAGMVINPQEIQAQGGGQLVLPTALEPGEYDYVIITNSTLAPGFESLREWKTRKGVPTRIVTTSWIYNEGGYSGSDEEKIRAFIIDAHDTWGTDYFLLGGDTNRVPCHWRSTPIEPYIIPNDTYYGDFDDDWLVEVHVGRVAASYASYVTTFNNKVFTYEQTPPVSDYPLEIAMLGFDLDDSTEGEECKEDIINAYLPPEWTVTTVYDSEAGTHKDDVIIALDAGQHLVNHIDHCDTSEMGAGSIHHGEYLYNTDLTGLTNADQQSIVYSLGCYACNFEFSVCIAEHFVRYDTGGALAFVGNSRFGWYNPGLTHTLSFRYDRGFWQALFAGGNDVLGDCFTAHKNAFFPTDNTYKYIFTELTLLGDPELPLWMAEPVAMIVDHPAQIFSGPSEVTIHVETAGEGNLAGAQVCLWKGEEVYLREETDVYGDAVFYADAETPGTMLVTVTERSCLPYQGEIEVLDSSGDVVSADPTASFVFYGCTRNPCPGPSEVRFGLPRASRVELEIYDLAGRQVRSLVGGEILPAGVHSFTWDGFDSGGRAVGAGVYLYRFDAGDFQATRKVVITG